MLLLKILVKNSFRHKLRTFLTVFGIVWGTVAIVVLLAFVTLTNRPALRLHRGEIPMLLVYGILGVAATLGFQLEDRIALGDAVDLDPPAPRHELQREALRQSLEPPVRRRHPAGAEDRHRRAPARSPRFHTRRGRGTFRGA